jgi:glycosyltransferase involved in cell wall biosynthesis
MSGGVACVIPAYDAAATVGAVVAGVRRVLPHAALLVVDDGSTDGTAAAAERAGAVVERFPTNRGKGAALRTAFARALADGHDAVLTIDADGQHDPAYAPALLAALDAADVVVGVRARRRTSMPLHRRVSNAISSAAISYCAGCSLPDAQSGFRAIRASVLRSVHPLGDRYEFETDLLILAARAGFRIAGVPVPTIYGAPSHFRALADSRRVVGRIWQRLPHQHH